MTLGVATHKTNLFRPIKKLESRKLVGRYNGQNRVEDVFYLTKKGLTVVLEEGLQEHGYCVERPSTTQAISNYDHTRMIVNCHIKLRSRINGFIKWVYEGKDTRVNCGSHNLEADSLIYTDHRLYALELHNRMVDKKILEKIEYYNKALSLGEPSLTYGFKNNTRVLHVFSDPTKLNYALKHVQSLPNWSQFEKFHYFIHFDQLESDERLQSFI